MQGYIEFTCSYSILNCRDTFPCGWDGGFDGEGLLFHGVREGDAAGVEGDAAVGVGAWGAVFEVAFYRAAEVGELAADLVVAAGKEFDLDEPVAVGPADLPVIQLGEFGVLAEGSGFADE